MSMSKQDFIALADAIRAHNKWHVSDHTPIFGPAHLKALAGFCRDRNGAFKKDRWMDYIAGECGPNGGAVKKEICPLCGEYAHKPGQHC